jgi:tetratricopeptide (TPR) repeat protein
MERVCAMSGEGYHDLASYYADRGRDEEARRAYERWLEVGRDQVGIANAMGWLVRYYVEHRQLAKADSLAERVAAVGSYSGLITQADLFDWRGNLGEAEQLYRRAYKRYDNGQDLLAFYLRHQVHGTKVDDVLRAVFPSGMTRAGATPLTAPSGGVIVRYAGYTALQEGLQKGDIVTAVDGVRVRTTDQYEALARAGADDVMQIVVWRGSKYVPLAPRLRRRSVIVTLDDYR